MRGWLRCVFAGVGRDGRVRISYPLLELCGHTRAVSYVRWLQNPAALVSASIDGTRETHRLDVSS